MSGSSMEMYALTLQQGTAIHQAVFGNFSSARASEFAVSHGKVLELLRADDEGKLHSVCSVEVFGLIRKLVPFRMHGAHKDHLMVGSDSGRLVVLLFDEATQSWQKVHQETYGKSGCRRIVPGQYLAGDPRGRAIMIGAIEKQKLVYVFTRDASARLLVQSPLEAHKNRTICFDMVGVDVGFENPIFACLEVDYSEADEAGTAEAAAETPKMLTYYELDLGLNHVTRKWAVECERSANMLITVPGGGDGPGGVIVCSENWVSYRNVDAPIVSTPIPRRLSMPAERNLLLISYAAFGKKETFFVLAQSELGDLYKITVTYTPTSGVTDLTVKYFDTIAPTTSLCITKRGMLFAASEFGDHHLYSFTSLGDDGDATGESHAVSAAAGEDVEIACFRPRSLRNLALTDTLRSMAPITQLFAADLVGEGSAQMYAITGRGTRSNLRVMRHGLSVNELAVTDLPGAPYSVWSISPPEDVAADRYIVVSFVNATFVLTLGDTVEPCNTSGLHSTYRTIAVGYMANGSLLQVYEGGIRHINTIGSDQRIAEWQPPAGKTIVHAAVNAYQVIIALRGGEIMYFELDATGQLAETEKRVMRTEVVAMDVANVDASAQRFEFLAVASADNVVRILSLRPEDLLRELSFQALPQPATSVCLADMQATDAQRNLFVVVGLENGMMHRTEVDRATGVLSDTRTRFLGIKPVRLARIVVGGRPAVLAMSARSWLLFADKGSYRTVPLSYEGLVHASPLPAAIVDSGVVAIAGSSLRIFAINHTGGLFNQLIHPLRYTPRKMVIHPLSRHLIIVESDHNSFSFQFREMLRQQEEAAAAAAAGAAGAKPTTDDSKGDDMDMDEDMEVEGDADETKAAPPPAEPESTETPEERLAREGTPLPAKPGIWASCIRIFNPLTNSTVHIEELDNNQGAFCCCLVAFHDRGGELFLLVGAAKDMVVEPRSVGSGYIHVYRILHDGRLQLLHSTDVEDAPYAMCPFNGRVLVGIGKTLRMYDMGRRRLLKKCETKVFPTAITNIHAYGNRIYVSDAAESVHFCKYQRSENAILVFADDTTPRYMTAMTLLDYHTVAGSDKFGNVFVLRVPADVNDDEVLNPTGKRLLWDAGMLNGAPNKVEQLVQFHVGEVVTSLQKVALPGGEECILYSTVMGGIGALIPFSSREDADFFRQLEIFLRTEAPSLVGREHVSYRSYFIPVRNVVDGDLCERFASLAPARQAAVATDMSRASASEILKKLENTRNRIL